MTEPTFFTFHIEVFTAGLQISGYYDLPMYRRISDALNGDPRRYMVLRDATVAPLAHPEQSQHVVELLVERAEALVVTTLEEPAPPPDYYSRDEVERFHGTRDTQQLLFFTTAFALRGEFSRRADLSLAEALERTTDDFLPLGNVQLFPLAGGQTLARDFACISRNRINAVCLMPGTTQPIPPPDLPQTEMLPLGAD